MDRRFSRNLSSENKGSVSLQKKLAESNRRQTKAETVPDLTDFMNDMFFGSIHTEKKAYNLTGGGFMDNDDDDEGSFDDSTRSNSSRLTQEWLEEAKRMVASSPSRCDSPTRLVGSPRFVSSQAGFSPSSLDRRDPLSRSARRHRPVDGFGGEIITKSGKHGRTKSESLDATPHSAADISPASAVNKWFSNILKPTNTNLTPSSDPTTNQNQTVPPLPPRQSAPRRSRFHKDLNATLPQAIGSPNSKRTFKTTTPAAELLSPPKTAKSLIESAHRRSVSSSTRSSLLDDRVLSPPRNLVESAHRKSISSSTCSTDRISRRKQNRTEDSKEADGGIGQDLNGYLKDQRVKIGKLLNGEINGKAKLVLSGQSNSTSSMVGAICYAWLLENRMKMGKEGGVEGEESVVVVAPVMNLRREKMWKQQQAAWLFHHLGIDATALLFSNEVDLEGLMMAKQLRILEVGQDVLRTNGEVGSLCTILTDNYCEDAYDLLETPLLKKLLLAGILLDTQNLNKSAALSMTRDAEAVQLLSVGSAPNYSNAFYDQLIQDKKDGPFFEALQHNYGRSPNENGHKSGAPVEQRNSERKSFDNANPQNSDKNVKSGRTNTVSSKTANPKSVPAQAPAVAPTQAADASRGKNQFFLAKWFGFGPK